MNPEPKTASYELSRALHDRDVRLETYWAHAKPGMTLLAQGKWGCKNGGIPAPQFGELVGLFHAIHEEYEPTIDIDTEQKLYRIWYPDFLESANSDWIDNIADAACKMLLWLLDQGILQVVDGKVVKGE